jgi:hypothetical protein
MNALRLDRSAFTPEVVLDPALRTLTLRGECYPENPAPFFTPILAALERCLVQGGPGSFEVTLQLSYVNSASTKALRRLLQRLDGAAERGLHVKVVWEHEASDETMAELGEDLGAGIHFIDLMARTYVLRVAS